MIRLALRAGWLCLLVSLAACTPTPEPLHLHGSAMGTTWQVTAYDPESRVAELDARIRARLDDLVAQMSAWEPDSALSRFNRAPAGTWMQLPEDLFTVLDHALTLAQQTDGAYDPTVAPLVDLWGFGPHGEPRDAPPNAAEIERIQARIGWARINLDHENHRVQQPGGVEVDINSLGPGYAVDAIAKVLSEAGVAHFLVELGGEMRAVGGKPDGSAWRIAVESPENPSATQFDTVVALHDAALGTSGDYRVGFIYAGQRYSHTLDPRSGAPVTHALASVTVIERTTMAADAMAAALMVLGPEKGMAFAKEHKLAAVFTVRHDNGFERLATPAFARYQEP